MITYKDQMTKDDKAFIAHAKKALGFDFNHVMDEARQEYQKHSIPSLAKREANLVILRELKEIGEEHWRKNKDESEPNNVKHVNKVPMPDHRPLPNKPTGKWKGKSILEMADEKLNK